MTIHSLLRASVRHDDMGLPLRHASVQEVMSSSMMSRSNLKKSYELSSYQAVVALD